MQNIAIISNGFLSFDTIGLPECDGQTDGHSSSGYTSGLHSSLCQRAGKNRRTTFYRVPHGEMTAKKWLDSIQKQKRIDLKEQREKHTDRRTDRVNEKKIMDFMARRGVNTAYNVEQETTYCYTN